MWYLECWNYFQTKKFWIPFLLPALRPMSADLNTNFGFVCELEVLIKSCTKAGLYQNTVSEDIWSWCGSNMLHAPVPFLGLVKHNTKSYLNMTPPQIVSLHCHCTRGHSLRHIEGKQGFMPFLRSGVGSRIEEGLLSRTDKFYIQSRERTNVFLYGILPVWILMKGLVSLDLSPANAWFNTVFYSLSCQLMFYHWHHVFTHRVIQRDTHNSCRSCCSDLFPVPNWTATFPKPCVCHQLVSESLQCVWTVL